MVIIIVNVAVYLIVILAILNSSGQPKLPTNFEEDTWAILKDAITAIFLKQKLSCDVEKLYQVIFLSLTPKGFMLTMHCF